MTNDRKAGIRMGVVVCAGIGVGVGLYGNGGPFPGWEGAMFVRVLGTAFAALIAMIFVHAIFGISRRCRSAGAADAAANGTPRSNEGRQNKRVTIPWEVAATKP